MVWFDEFKGSILPWTVFLAITDKWGARVEQKGSSIETFFKKVLISTTVPPGEWWRCANYFKNPRQLWRRLTRVYYIAGPRTVEGRVEHSEPELIPDPERDVRCNPYFDGIGLHYPKILKNRHYFSKMGTACPNSSSVLQNNT